MKKIIITAGGTSERIDNVRKITNSSSGKLGTIIVNHLLQENKDKSNKEISGKIFFIYESLII